MPSSGGPLPAPEPAPMPNPTTEIVPAEEEEEASNDNDSSVGSDTESSTASLSSSILQYRQIQGRTFHSDRFVTEYMFPLDDQQLESGDMTHHYLTILLDGRLSLAPIKKDTGRALDVGTGSGIWAMDFADEHPEAEVIATDLAPTQPEFVPPNLRFEIDDATQPWTWEDNTFDFIHMRFLMGAIGDWDALYKEAYRCTEPGGYIESVEADVHFRSDDGSTELEPALQMCDRLYEESERITGRKFFVQDLQPKGIEGAGFVDVKTVDYKVPGGDWPKDPKLSQIGKFVKLALQNDIEGFTLYLWNNILGWPKDEYQIFLMDLRKALRNRKVHSWFTVRYVYGRKPE